MLLSRVYLCQRSRELFNWVNTRLRAEEAGKGTFAVKAVCQCSTAAFMSPRPPFRIYRACACRKDAGVWVFIVVVASYRWKAEGLDMSTRKSHSKDGLLRMESLCEELGGERKSAEILKHFCRQGMIQWMNWVIGWTLLN
jgi:hypothetical protein